MLENITLYVIRSRANEKCSGDLHAQFVFTLPRECQGPCFCYNFSVALSTLRLTLTLNKNVAELLTHALSFIHALWPAMECTSARLCYAR